MSKVMIVEDDDALREIYGIRLTAEGYTVVSARDGEEALAVAMKERPDLIVSDVMMPKISGFDILDIIRSTPEMANTRVIMMTALSSEDQRERSENLRADRYLVKSQVGIEDVVNTVHDVLGDRGGNMMEMGTQVATAAMPSQPMMPPATPQSPAMSQMQPAMPQQPMQQTNIPPQYIQTNQQVQPQPGTFPQQPQMPPQQAQPPMM